MTRLAPTALALGLLLGCADTNALPPDPVELLAVANSQGNSVSVVPVDQSESPTAIQLGSPRGRAMSLAAVDRYAIVPLGDLDEVAVLDLQQRILVHRIVLPAGSGLTGAIMLDDSIGYVASSSRNSANPSVYGLRWPE